MSGHAGDNARTLPAFLCGLFTDVDVPRAKGVEPRRAPTVTVLDHAIRLGAKAMLPPMAGQCARGVQVELTRHELDPLYSNLPDYREPAATALLDSGDAIAAVSMVHRSPPISSSPEPAYAAQWEGLVRKLNLRTDHEGRP